MTTRRLRLTPTTVLSCLAALAVLVLAFKWLLVTAAILAIPFGVWWCVDRARGTAPAAAPSSVPSWSPVPAPAPRATRGRVALAPAVLPAQVPVTVTREGDHQPALARHHRPGGGPSRVVAELVSSRVTRGKYQGAYAVEVRLDGARVGELTAAMSRRYADLVREAEDRGAPARAEAVVSIDPRGLQIDLRLPRST